MLDMTKPPEIPDDVLDDEETGAERVYRSRKMALYVIGVGLSKLRHERRRLSKLRLKAELPATTERVSAPSGDGKTSRPYATFSEEGAKKMRSMTEEWLGSNGWFIGSRNLMEFTRDELRVEVDREHRSRDGHEANAKFYEALIAPMKNGDQTIGDFWLKRKGPRPEPPSPTRRAAA